MAGLVVVEVSVMMQILVDVIVSERGSTGRICVSTLQSSEEREM